MKKLAIILPVVCLLTVLLVVQGAAADQRTPVLAPAVTRDLKIEATPQRLGRGEYLVRHVVQWLDCHSSRDYSRFSAPIIPGTEGIGGEDFSGPYGSLHALNITPFAIGEWSDYGLYKTLTTGLNPDGEQLFPVMPYMMYSQTSQDDIFAIIAYIRTLKAVESHPPEPALTVPPEAFTPPPGIGSQLAKSPPSMSDHEAYVRYMSVLAPCTLCHTPPDATGMPDMTKYFAGGFEWVLPMPSGRRVRSLNLTPDQQTGIGLWSRERFIRFIQSFSEESTWMDVGEHGYNTMMPLNSFSGMTHDDLGTMYDYLRTLPPMHSEIEEYPPD